MKNREAALLNSRRRSTPEGVGPEMRWEGLTLAGWVRLGFIVLVIVGAAAIAIITWAVLR